MVDSFFKLETYPSPPQPLPNPPPGEGILKDSTLALFGINVLCFSHPLYAKKSFFEVVRVIL